MDRPSLRLLREAEVVMDRYSTMPLGQERAELAKECHRLLVASREAREADPIWAPVLGRRR